MYRCRWWLRVGEAPKAGAKPRIPVKIDSLRAKRQPIEIDQLGRPAPSLCDLMLIDSFPLREAARRGGSATSLTTLPRAASLQPEQTFFF